MQSIYNWQVIYEYALDDEGRVKCYCCTWEELLILIPSEHEPIAIVRLGLGK